MRKIITIGFLMFFVQFFILGGFFVRLDSYKPFNTSGNPMASALALIITMISCSIYHTYREIYEYKF